MHLLNICPNRTFAWWNRKLPIAVQCNGNRLQASDSGKSASSFFSRVQSCVRQTIRQPQRRLAVRRLGTAKSEAGKPYWDKAAIAFHQNTGASFDNLANKRKIDASLLKHEFGRCLKQLDAKGEYAGLSDGRRQWIAYGRARTTIASYRKANAKSIYAHRENTPTLSHIDASGNALYHAHMKYAESKTDDLLASHFKAPPAALKAWTKLDQMWEKYKSADKATKQDPETIEDLKHVCAAVVFAENLKKAKDAGHARSTLSAEIYALADAAFAKDLPISGAQNIAGNLLLGKVQEISEALAIDLTSKPSEGQRLNDSTAK